MLTALLLALPAPVAFGEPRLRDCLPADAVFVAVIEDFATLWERARATNWAGLVTEPALEPLWGRADAFLQQKFDSEETTLTRALDALAGVAFYRGSIEQDNLDAMGLVLRLRPGFPGVASALRASLEDAGEETVEIDGRRFTAGRGGYSSSWEVSFAWSEGFAVIDAPERENALRVAASLARALEADTPGEVGDGRLPLAHDASGSSLETWLDVGSLIATTATPRGEDELRMFEALALDEFGWCGLHLALDRDSTVELELSLDLPARGLWPILTGNARPVTTRLAQLAPSDAIKVSTLGYDVRGAWSDVRAWLEEELPEGAEDLEQGLKALETSAEVDLEREVIAGLTGDFARFLIPRDESEESSLNGIALSVLIGLIGSPGADAGSVYLIGVEEVAAVERLARKLVDLSEAPELVQETTVAGRRMWSVDAPDMPLQPSWAFLDGTVVASLYGSSVRRVLEQGAEDTPPGWLNAERRDALGAGGVAFGSTLGDLEKLIRINVLAPVTAIAEVLSPIRIAQEPSDSASFATIAGALPALVQTHVTGTARSTLTADGRTVRYRLWTE